jgi:hypothetical protein
MRPSLRLAAFAVVLIAGAAAAGWTFGRPALARRHDVAVRRSLYESFPVFPGSIKTDERSYEIKADGTGTGDYGLTLTYRLPPTASAAAVVDFYRRSMPAGWTEASDELCARLEREMPPPPAATWPAASASPPTTVTRRGLVLVPEEGELAVFAPGGDGRHGQGLRGITFKVSTAGAGKLLTLDQVTFTCAPPPG